MPFSSAALVLPENSNARLLQAFMGLQLSAGIAITFTTLTVLLSARVKRHATWISFCISWIISCFSYTLLLFCGHETKHAPAYSLCLFQSVLIYSTPMLAAYTTLALVVHLYFSLRMMLCEDGESTGIHSFWLLSVPYVLCGVMAVIALDLGLAHPESVFRDQFYCRINTGIPGKISSVFVILAGVGIIVYEVLSAKVLYQRWHLFCYTESSQKPSVAFMARIVCFTSFTTIGVCIALIFSLKAKISSSQMHDATNILLALVPVAAFFTAGIGKDMVDVWLFWRTGFGPDRVTASEDREACGSLP